MRNIVHKLLHCAGFEVCRRQKANPDRKNFLFESDAFFFELFRRGSEVCRMDFPPGYNVERRYNTYQLFRAVEHLPGFMAECGCYRGLTGYMLCHAMKKRDAAFDGTGYLCIDSFEGLSTPSAEDAISSADYGIPGEQTGQAGMFAASLEEVKAALHEFPGITFCRGWIPQCFSLLPEQRYKFVHLDLDLYEPTCNALRYFYPRMVAGGVLVIDEYGLPRWPGAQQATDEFCAAQGIQPLALTTGNAAIFKLG